MSSGIADQWAEQSPFITFEGVNVLMYQQSARLLIKQVEQALKGRPVKQFFTYLAKMQELMATPSGATTVEQFLEPDHIQRALATRSAYFAKKIVTKRAASKAPSKEKQNSLFAIDVNRMVKLHLINIMYERSRLKVESSNIQDANLKRTMLCTLANFALKFIMLDSAPLYECGFFREGASDLLDAAYN